MVNKIKSQVKLLDILNHYGLKLINNKTCCPFHNEKTPSFSVKGEIWKCFGCGSGGDSIGFVMKINNCEFSDACKIIDGIFDLNLYAEPTFAEYRHRQKQILEQKQLREEKEQDQEFSQKQFKILCAYNIWLLNQPMPRTRSMENDIIFMDRTIDKYISKDNLIKFDAFALCSALMSKHKAVEDGYK